MPTTNPLCDALIMVKSIATKSQTLNSQQKQDLVQLVDQLWREKGCDPNQPL